MKVFRKFSGQDIALMYHGLLQKNAASFERDLGDVERL
jgi:hypothetical protein